MYKIVFDDVVYSIQKAGGISELWDQISLGAPKGSEHIVYPSAKNNYVFHEIEGMGYDYRSESGFNAVRFLDVNVKDDDPFIFHSSYFRICNNRKAVNIVHIYDFIYETYRTDFKSLFTKIQKKRAIKKADAIICISESTKNDLMKYCPSHKGIIKVIHCGYDSDAYKCTNKDLRKNQIVYVGARKRYKRFDYAVELMKKLPEFEFIIVGSGDLTEDQLELLKPLEGRYKKLGFQEKDRLAEIYNESFALLYSSDYEGFGIPPIEAQACGCPVICQESSSLIEVVNGTGIVLKPYDLQYTADEVMKLKNEEVFHNLQERGLENVKRFSWDKCRKETYDLYEEISKNK